MNDEAQESVLEMETSAETAKYRQSRLMWWTSIIHAHEDYIADARKYGATQVAAEAAASKHESGEVRALLSELLTRAPVDAIVQFLGVTRALDDPAALFQHREAVTTLIESAYPRRTWATKMDKLAAAVAADDASWSVWAAGWGEEFAAVGKAAADVLIETGAAVGKVGLGLADGLATLLRWTPYVLGGAVLLGVVVVASRK